ncbi:MAG: glutamate formimidoyltransferase [Planctomycetes bacterium]|nr:glutamate formimidoyltransferase [Planctomycetota bacterium]
MPIVECVPNFSEGRRHEVIEAIAEAIRAVDDVRLLGYEADADHNRSVFTIAGEPGPVSEGAFQACRKAAELINLNEHQGEHPRMGATDVIPFIPISEIDMPECVKLAEALGERIGKELEIPVFLYGEAARTPERQNLADVRKGQFEGLREEIGQNSSRKPDFGPERIHPTAGATAVGARFFLIAYNVNLDTTDLKLAKRIAKTIREKDGGMPGVKAMGFELKEEKCVQVSMNLVDYRKTSPAQVFNRIAELAEEAGVQIKDSEVVGLLPQDALELCARQTMEMKKLQTMEGAGLVWLNQFAAETLKLRDFAPAEQIIELKLEDFEDGMERFQYLKDISKFAADLASAAPTPGGGAAAAVLGTTGIALGEMVGNLTIGKKKYAEVEGQVKDAMGQLTPLREPMLAMFEKDAQAFDAFGEAGKLPKDTDEQKAVRTEAMQKALKNATLSPDATAELGVKAFRQVYEIAKVGNKHAISDCGCGALALYASINAAVLNMYINLPGIKDAEFQSKYQARAEAYEKEAKELLDGTLKVVRAAIGG